MTVSTRNTLLAGFAATSMVVMSGIAVAGGGPGGGKGPATTPGSGGTHGGPCCKTPRGPIVIIPGVNVSGPNVMVQGSTVSVSHGSVVSNTQSFINTSIVSGGDRSVIVSGGGGFFAPQGVTPTAIPNLRVEGGEETITETEDYCEDQISVTTITRPVQAVCLDDKGAPHPASQVDTSHSIAATYKGEVFRCMAGTNMQVTLGSMQDGSASFASGETFACRKGEALVHGGNGQLTCAPQTPQRDCNERSLLRRHGPGIKLVQYKMSAKTCLPRTRTVTKTVQGEGSSEAMIFDGGVGQGIY